MSFTTIHFFVFLWIVFLIYWNIPHKYRWLLLLISSTYFYMQWKVKYLIWIFFTIIVSYVFGFVVEKEEDEKRRKRYLLISCVLCLSVLFIFKYFHFFMDSVGMISHIFGVELPEFMLPLILPVGISFYTFQTMSYVIDIYRREIPAERHFGNYAAYVLFFPQLVAGPIERSRNFLPQIKKEKVFDYEQAASGLRQMLWGYFKKIVIANTLAFYVDLIYESYGVYAYKGFSLLLVAVMFSFQIYCDFSGYSDIAIGAGKLFGIHLMENFKSPYFSESIKEFWSRWHISLSSWMRDYIYIPLGGNRKGNRRTCINLLITFLISGLWHGAAWHYVVWGGLHGAGQIGERLIGGRRRKENRDFGIGRWVRILFTFSFVTAGWVFFRALDTASACYVLTHLFSGITSFKHYIYSGIVDLQLSFTDIVMLGGSVLALLAVDFYALRENAFIQIKRLSAIKRWLLYYACSGMILYYFYQQTDTVQFIYFQF